MFALLFDLEDYATTYRATRDAYLKAANELKHRPVNLVNRVHAKNKVPN